MILITTDVEPKEPCVAVFTREGERLTFKLQKLEGMGLNVLVCIHEDHNAPSTKVWIGGKYEISTQAVAIYAGEPWVCEYGQAFAESISVMELIDKEP